MKYLAVVGLLLVAGCATKPVPPIELGGPVVIDANTVVEQSEPVRMPSLPDNLAKKAGRLPDMTDPTVEGQQIDAMAADRAYNDVSHQMNAIIDLWVCVKAALDNKTAPDACLKEK